MPIYSDNEISPDFYASPVIGEQHAYISSSDALLTILGSQDLLAVNRMSQHCKVTASKSFSGLTTTKTRLSISYINTTLTELPFICKQFQYWVSDTSVL